MDDIILKGYIQIKCSNPGRLKRKVGVFPDNILFRRELTQDYYQRKPLNILGLSTVGRNFIKMCQNFVSL